MYNASWEENTTITLVSRLLDSRRHQSSALHHPLGVRQKKNTRLPQQKSYVKRPLADRNGSEYIRTVVSSLKHRKADWRIHPYSPLDSHVL